MSLLKDQMERDSRKFDDTDYFMQKQVTENGYWQFIEFQPEPGAVKELKKLKKLSETPSERSARLVESMIEGISIDHSDSDWGEHKE